MAIAMGMTTGTVFAQDQYDLGRLSTSDLNGTARYIGMGGAMSALGADISSMSNNPAGLGIYRSSDISVTAGLNMLNAGNLNQNGTTRGSFDQIGVAIASKYSNYSSLKYINYGFNYHRRANFFDDFTIDDNWTGEFSQTFQMEQLTYGENISNMPALAAAAAKSGALIKNGSNEYLGQGAYDTYYSTRSTGGIHDYDFSVAFNWQDQYFLGVTVGYSHASFDRGTWYTEYLGDDTSYDMYNYYRTRGDGMNFKLGGIIRPVDESNFRFGLSLQSPTFYLMTDENGVDITSYDQDGTEMGNGYSYADPVDYQFSTPWKFNFSLGTTWSDKIALGAEYELQDYQSIKIHDHDGYDNDYTMLVRDLVKSDLRTVHTFKVGGEFKVTPSVALRAGYNFSTAVYEKNAYRSLADFTDIYVDTFTETSYSNSMNLHRLTCGIGYRTSSFYADLAYQYTMQKADFYPFDDSYEYNGSTTYVPGTEIKKNRSKLSLTLGYRF